MVLSPGDRDVLLSVLFPEGEVDADDSQYEPNCTTGRDEPTQLKPVKVKKSRRRRYRRKHEVDALRIKVVKLAAQLERLRHKETRTALEGEDTPGEKGGDDEIWESRAGSQREQTRIAIIENIHLRAQYEVQLETIKRLDAMYYNYQVIMAMNASVEKHFRTHPFENDIAIFSSLGTDFDAQYAKVDSILKAAGLPTTFDQNISRDMQLRRSVNGIHFLENIRCKVTPRNMFAAQGARPGSRRRNELLHEVYEFWEQTDDTNVRKMVDTIHLPHTNATLTTRTALRKYKEANRTVAVWDTVFEITGPVSMRFRERGWQLKHQLHETPFAHLDVEQACVRITPELCGAYSAQDVAVGSLANLLVASYHRHIRRIYNAPGRIAPRS
uniref:Uncharacterized protein n=1 Tax=Globisporangium ultimum (strain ATCC 200006 / CBS 805.95 / DAOM BR144) TaxID=431595 RepID=K3W918_GLOUD